MQLYHFEYEKDKDIYSYTGAHDVDPSLYKRAAGGL